MQRTTRRCKEPQEGYNHVVIESFSLWNGIAEKGCKWPSQWQTACRLSLHGVAQESSLHSFVVSVCFLHFRWGSTCLKFSCQSVWQGSDLQQVNCFSDQGANVWFDRKEIVSCCPCTHFPVCRIQLSSFKLFSS